MTAPRPTSTSADPPKGCGPAWERPGARAAGATVPHPTGPSTDHAQEAGGAGGVPIDERALSKLRWRCRRGLLENDLFIDRFFARHGATLNEDQARGLLSLMDLADNDLLDLLLGRREPAGELERDDVWRVLRLMRSPT